MFNLRFADDIDIDPNDINHLAGSESELHELTDSLENSAASYI